MRRPSVTCKETVLEVQCEGVRSQCEEISIYILPMVYTFRYSGYYIVWISPAPRCPCTRRRREMGCPYGPARMRTRGTRLVGRYGRWGGANGANGEREEGEACARSWVVRTSKQLRRMWGSVWRGVDIGEYGRLG